jgi:hypothetical protein
MEDVASMLSLTISWEPLIRSLKEREVILSKDKNSSASVV